MHFKFEHERNMFSAASSPYSWRSLILFSSLRTPPHSTFFRSERESEKVAKKIMFIASESESHSSLPFVLVLRRLESAALVCIDVTRITFAMQRCTQRIRYSVVICLDIDAFTPTKKKDTHCSLHNVFGIREQYRPFAGSDPVNTEMERRKKTSEMHLAVHSQSVASCNTRHKTWFVWATKRTRRAATVKLRFYVNSPNLIAKTLSGFIYSLHKPRNIPFLRTEIRGRLLRPVHAKWHHHKQKIVRFGSAVRTGWRT